MTWVSEDLEKTQQIRLDREKAQAVAYDISAAQDRVTAAQARANANFQTLAEFAATPGGQKYMDLPPDRDLMQELRRR